MTLPPYSLESDSPEPVPQKSDLARAAAFLDGEACIAIARQRHQNGRPDTYRLGVHIAQNDLQVLEAFRTAVGIGAPIYATKRADNHSHQSYSLSFSGRSAQRLLTTLMPYLRRKLAEATAALEFWTEGRIGVPGPGKCLSPELAATRERYYLLLKRLK